jgi:hypothetical protein
VFGPNKCIISKYGTSISKGYKSEDLFYLSLSNARFKSMNQMRHDNKTNIWHSHFCHINFVCMAPLAGMDLILKIDLVKGSKCHMCM